MHKHKLRPYVQFQALIMLLRVFALEDTLVQLMSLSMFEQLRQK